MRSRPLDDDSNQEFGETVSGEVAQHVHRQPRKKVQFNQGSDFCLLDLGIHKKAALAFSSRIEDRRTTRVPPKETSIYQGLQVNHYSLLVHRYRFGKP